MHGQQNIKICNIRFSAPSFWVGGGLDSRCVGRVYGADGARHYPHRTPYSQTTSAHLPLSMSATNEINITVNIVHWLV